MPIYEYHCKKCDEAFEKLVPNSRAPLPVCPTCGSKSVERQLSAFSAVAGGGRKDTCSLGACPSGHCAGGGCMLER